MRRGVARAANAGAPREEWVREAIHGIAVADEADRIGVWLEAEPLSDAAARGQFRGLVWDRHASETPAQWRQLCPEAPLPREVLAGVGSAELDLEASPPQTILGPLLELRRALWVPVQTRNRLRGLVLVGVQRKGAALSRQPAERAAAELALALENEEQQHRAQGAQADLTLARQTLQSLGSGTAPEIVLQKLVESCVKAPGVPAAPAALFAAIGMWECASNAPESASQPAGKMNFLWTAGERVVGDSLQSGPLFVSWRTAIEGRRIIGSEIRGISSMASPGRAVAVPLEAHGQLVGVLVAVLPGAAASLAMLERLELRASLAAEVLSRKAEADQQGWLAAAGRSALRASSQPAVLLDAQGLIVEFSRAARDFFVDPNTPRALPIAKKTGRPFSTLFRASEQAQVASWLRRQLALPRAAGNARAAEALEAELENGQRVRAHSPFSGADASLMLLMERISGGDSVLALDSSETELHNVIEWLEEGVILFDAQDQVRAINMRFEQMVGLASEESGKYRTLSALIDRLERHAADPRAFAGRWRSLAQGIDGGVREELQMALPVPRLLERSARPILDSIGRLVGRVEIYRDLTAQRVFQSKLLQTEKLAALGQMLTGVAHELSNPLTTVLGYAQRLLTRKDAAGQSQEARQIYQEAERAGRILRQLLSHARETPPERRSLSLNQVVLRTAELQRFGLANEKVRLELDLDPAPPMVLGDPGQLQQVLMNLLGNARQAIEQQGGRGTVRVRTGHDSGDRVTLAVEDTGPGVPPGILARVFDPFFTTKPPGVGTGLGLSIVLSIVREHGGNVRVTNASGGGACFMVELPALKMPALVSQEPDLAARGLRESVSLDAPAPRARSTATGAGRILVVEDEPTVARLIADVLEDEGFQVAVLLDGREALERATRESFDLVICDMKMPGLDGQHFYKSLKRAVGPPGCRFLFVTGDTIGPHTQTFLMQHRLPYLSKPFRVEELAEHVWRVLRDPDSGARPAIVTKKSAARNG